MACFFFLFFHPSYRPDLAAHACEGMAAACLLALHSYLAYPWARLVLVQRFCRRQSTLCEYNQEAEFQKAEAVSRRAWLPFGQQHGSPGTRERDTHTSFICDPWKTDLGHETCRAREPDRFNICPDDHTLKVFMITP